MTTSATLSSDLGFIGERAFGNCEDLADVYCLADEVSTSSLLSHKGLYTYPNAFEDSYPQLITLHAPAASIEVYRSTAPWSTFKYTGGQERCVHEPIYGE